MEQASPAHKSFWRFSLRELLLLVLAAGAVIGWAVVLYQSQQIKPSRFFIENEAWDDEVIAANQEIDEPLYKHLPGVTIRSDGPASVQRTVMFRIPLHTSKRQAFSAALQKRVREKLTKVGCHRSGETAGSGEHSDHAILGYASGRVSGTVQIGAISADDGYTVVILTTHEQRGGAGTFGVEIRD